MYNSLETFLNFFQEIQANRLFVEIRESRKF